MKTRQAHLLFLLVFGAAVFLPAIGSHDLWPADEPRYAQVSREMMESGDYLMPRINGMPYREKPPLFFWAIAAASAPFGDVNAVSARIPSVVSALVVVALTYALAARLYDPRVAFWAALMLITSKRFWWQATHAQIDMVLTACMAGCLYAFWRWHGERRNRWLVVFYVCSAAGVFAKGPVGIVFPLLLIFAFYWRRPEPRKQMHWLAGTVAVIVLVSVWLIPAYMTVSQEVETAAHQSIAQNLLYQTAGRFILGVSKAQWPWYYLETLPIDWLPWSLFLPWTAYYVWKRRREGEEMRLLLCWTVPAFIFFSISIGKRALYLLPLFPALAILMGRSVLALADGPRETWRRRTGLIWAVVLLLSALLPFGLLLSEYAEAWTPNLLVFSACALFFGLITLDRCRRTDMSTLSALVAAHFAGLAIVIPLTVFPVVNQFKSARFFCEPIRILAEAGEQFELYSAGFTREEYIFYAHRFHTPVFCDLFNVEVDPPLPARENTRLQERMRDRIAEAASEVPVESIDTVTLEELAALDKAVREAAADNVDPEWRRAFFDAMARETDEFLDAFEVGPPAFAFVMENDWRWILPVHPEARTYPVLRGEQVGRRYVLLLANDAGAELAERYGIEIKIKPAEAG